MLDFLKHNKKIHLSLGLILILTVIVYPAETYANVVSDAIMGTLWFLVTSVFGWLVWAAGLLLNTAVGTYVVGFGSLFETSGLGYSVNSLWAVVRDIFNLTFIFGMVYIGFKMILNSGDSEARKMLGSLVIAALLVNFSLFITKFVIDFSNIAATQFAQAFNVGGTYTVSDGFMKLLGLSSMFDTASDVGKLDAPAGFAYIFGSLFLYLVTAFVFAAGGVLLIIRFVVLNFYMILSPLMFLGLVFPGLSNISKEYWQGFLGRAFFAPAYLLMLYFAHQILVNMKGVTAAGSTGMANVFGTKDATVAANSFSSTIVFFIITSVFLIASLVIAQKMGAVGASNAMAIGKRLAGKAQRAATYPARAGARILTNKGGEYLEKKLNNAQTGSGVAAKILKFNKVDQALRGATSAAAGAKYGTGTTNKDERDYRAKTESRASQTEIENGRLSTLNDNIEKLADIEKNKELSGEDLQKALTALSKTIRDMTVAEKEKLGAKTLQNANVAMHLSDSDIDEFQKSGKYNSKELQEIKEARSKAYEAVATNGSTLSEEFVNRGDERFIASQREALMRKSVKEIGKMPTAIFTNRKMAAYINPETLSEKMKNGGVSNDEQAAILTNIQAYLDDPATEEKKRAAWKKWAESSTYGSGFGLNIPPRQAAGAAAPEASPIYVEPTGRAPRSRTTYS
jgi:hypothetical protein